MEASRLACYVTDEVSTVLRRAVMTTPSRMNACKRLSKTYPTLSNPTACYTPSGSSPYAACDVMILSSKTTEFDETNSSNSPWVEHDYTYDDYSVSGGFPTCTGQQHTFCRSHILTPEVISGAVTMKIISRTRKISVSGVMLIEAKMPLPLFSIGIAIAEFSP